MHAYLSDPARPKQLVTYDASTKQWVAKLSDGTIIRQSDKDVLESFLDWNENRKRGA